MQAGVVPESMVDRAVARLLTARLRLGEFDDSTTVPFRNSSQFNEGLLEPALATLSADAARQTLVLLKNSRGTLPLFAG